MAMAKLPASTSRRWLSTSARALAATRLSTRFVPTLKDDALQANANELESLRLLLRAGFIRQSSSGVFTLLPNALRIVNKITKIVDQEMESIGASRLEMPTILPSALWHKTGRFEVMGNELYRLRDRRGSEYILAPTHEEEVTKLVSTEVESWRSLPVKVYQITGKHRDEPRPRSGLLRTREFLMKDLYTFDADLPKAIETYEDVRGAYSRVLDRLLETRSPTAGSRARTWKVAEADSGAIGGSRSHEYHLEDEAGEDTLMSCSTCDYAANSERAASLPSRDVPHTADDVVVQLFGPSDPLAHGATLTAVITPRRRERNPLKVGKHLLPDSRELKDGANEWDWKDRPEGPLVRYESVRLLVDFECAGLDNDDLEEAMLRSILAYAAPPDKASLPPSAEGPSLADFFPNQLGDEVAPLPLQLVDARTAEEGDTCPRCRKGHLHSTKAIEVGHTFLLGTKYSEALDATFAAQPEPAVGGSKSAAPARKHFQMGCYGLGITRLLGAIAQRAFDKRGFVWPESIAPFSAVVLPSSPATSEKTAAAERLCAALERGISRNAIYGHDATDAPEKLEGSGEEEAVLCARDDVAVDDRYTLSMGVRLKDAELVGYPLVFVLGKHWEKTGEVEIQYRRTGTKAYVPLEKLL